MENYYELNTNYNDRLNAWVDQIKETNKKTVIYSLSDINYSLRFDEMIQTFNTPNACFAMCALDKETYNYFTNKNIPTVLLDKEEDNFNHLVCISKFLLTKVLLKNGFNVIMTEADIFWKTDVTTIFNTNAELTVSQHTYSPEVNIGFYRVISNENTIKFFDNLMDWIYDPKCSYTQDVYKNIYLNKKPHYGVDQKIFDCALRQCNDSFLRKVGYNFSTESFNKLKTVQLNWDYLSYNILMHWPIRYPNNYSGVHVWSGYNKIPSEQIKYAHSYNWFCNQTT